MVENPNLYRPGVKWNIALDGFSHVTELFGPILGVMSFSRLEEAIEIVRRTGYGLTSGLETLDDREIALWRENIRAGNLYINRSTTGAIVLRQPFGGVGLSAYGPGVKAGGPHYVLALTQITDANRSEDEAGDLDISAEGPLRGFLDWMIEAQARFRIGPGTFGELKLAIASQQHAVEKEFSREHDSIRLVGQDNIRRYLPIRSVTIRVTQQEDLRDALIGVAAAVAVGTRVTLSLDPGLHSATKETLESTADHLPGWVDPMEETDDELATRIREGHVNRLRLLKRSEITSPAEVACADRFVTIIDEPVLLEGRIECLRYLDEQSISHDYHRYGNLGRRADESRRAVL
jgi:RHH-type proline utilization regulon transcriptional repressor/proline dehydrogenase/delta 1-pyrroline-5-carboxylate dehydrogenase